MALYVAQVSNWYMKLPLTQCPYCTAFSLPPRRTPYTLVPFVEHSSFLQYCWSALWPIEVV